jgi:hypothetical protein
LRAKQILWAIPQAGCPHAICGVIARQFVSVDGFIGYSASHQKAIHAVFQL